MKILLINPPNSGRSIPEEEYGITSIKQIFRGEPFNLEVLAGPLTDHDVIILDLKCEAEDSWKILDDFRPDLVGFTALTCEANTVIRLATEIKERTSSRIAVGGTHATYDPEYFNRSCFDFIISGLGKKSFHDLADSLARGGTGEGIPGIARTTPGRSLNFIPRNFGAVDLMEEFPPRYDLVARYRNHYILEQLGLKMGFVITAYGCTHRCSFCTIPRMTGGKYLTHSADTVVRDIQLLGDIPFIRMVDANTFGNASLSLSVYEKIIGSGIKKRFFADVRADTIVLHPELMKKWKEAGLYAVVVGFEDIHDKRLNAYEKKYESNVIAKAINILHDTGIIIVGDFIASPDYDENDFRALEDFIAAGRIEIPVVSILTPLPGTKLYSEMKEQITITDLDYYTFTNAVTKTKIPQNLFYQTYADMVKRLHGKLHKN